MQFNRQFLIVAKPQDVASWERLLTPRYGDSAVQTLELPGIFFEKDHFSDWHQLKQYFNQVVAKLGQYRAADLRNLVVIIPAYTELPNETASENTKRWNPSYFRQNPGGDQRYTREIVFSWLILAFPEVRFVFLTDKNVAKKTLADFPEQLHLMPSNFGADETIIKYLQRSDFPVLFDPSGLRDSIRSLLKGPEPRHPGVWRREEKAVVLEDEMTFSYFLGYAAYRSGCQTWLAHNFRQAENLLGKNEKEAQAEFAISLEDLALGFPDKETVPHLSDLKERKKKLPLLNRVKRRCIITYGGLEKKTWRSQVREYNLRNRPFKSMSVISKPLPDFFALRKKTQLYQDIWRPTRQKNAQKLKSAKDEQSESPHSAEGILLDIATILIRRARKVISDQAGIIGHIQAALLALEAKELLGGKTPTLSLEALELQHRCEVAVECISHGTDYNLDVHSRALEIRKEVQLIAQHYRIGTSHKVAELAASSIILGNLSGIYSQYKQIEEYEHTLIETRYLSGQSFFYKHPLLWPLCPFRWYFEFLLKSLRHFAFAVICWFLILSLLWNYVFPPQDFSETVYASFDYLFFDHEPEWMDTAMKMRWSTRGLLTLSALVRWTHIGVLITDAVARVQRK